MNVSLLAVMKKNYGLQFYAVAVMKNCEFLLMNLVKSFQTKTIVKKNQIEFFFMVLQCTYYFQATKRSKIVYLQKRKQIRNPKNRIVWFFTSHEQDCCTTFFMYLQYQLYHPFKFTTNMTWLFSYMIYFMSS